jgi:hypothetical protein
MAKLPFVVEPRRKPIVERIGNEESGIIEIERLGYLTTGEKAFVQQVQQFDNGTTEIVTLSRRVARKYGMGMDKAYGLVIGIMSGQESNQTNDRDLADKVEEEFAVELTEVIKSLSNGQVREDMVMAACMVRYRLDPNYEISDISKLHPDLIAGLANLYREEEAKVLDAFKQEDDESSEITIEEAEKKLVTGPKSRSKTSTTD